MKQVIKHFLISSLAVLAIYAILSMVTKLDNSTSLTLSPVIVFIIGFVKEIYDKIKKCDWNDLDIVANTLGILFGLAILLVLK